MPCAEWCQLVERYRSAVDAYNEAVMALGGIPGTAFNEKWSHAERARTKSDRCRTDLLHHEHVHACLEVGQLNDKRQMSGNTENLVWGIKDNPAAKARSNDERAVAQSSPDVDHT